MPPTHPLSSNKTILILAHATAAGYGVVSPVIYNLEQILGAVKAAEAKRAPLIIEMFPWAVTFSNGLLARAARHAADAASIPVSVHLDHAQDYDFIKEVADAGLFDSIMVDMSHYPREENLRR